MMTAELEASRRAIADVLTNAPFRAVHGPKGPVIVWLNLSSKLEVDELLERLEGYRGEDYRCSGGQTVEPA